MKYPRLSAALSAVLFNLTFSGTLFLNGCATAEKPAVTAAADGAPAAVKKTESQNVDPYESFNRVMFKFNDHLDDYLAKPISDAYLFIAPSIVKQGVTNFFSNLKDINVVINDSMQGKFEQGAEDTGRLIANSTLGLLGLVDVATDLGLKKHEEDFGQTLAVWGIPRGAYLVLPILGPSTTRGLPGSLLDIAANPSTYFGAPVQVISMLNTRANAEGSLKFINEAAIDPYLFTREAYLQNQQHLITDGKVSTHVDILPLEEDLEDPLDDKNNAATGKTKPGAEKTDAEQENMRTEQALAANAYAETDAKIDALEKKLERKRHRHRHRHVLPKPETETLAPAPATPEVKPAEPQAPANTGG